MNNEHNSPVDECHDYNKDDSNQINDIASNLNKLTLNAPSEDITTSQQSHPTFFFKENQSQGNDDEGNSNTFPSFNKNHIIINTNLQDQSEENTRTNNTPRQPSLRTFNPRSPTQHNKKTISNYVVGKAKTQQYKHNNSTTNRQALHASPSPMCSYYDANQKYLMENLHNPTNTNSNKQYDMSNAGSNSTQSNPMMYLDFFNNQAQSQGLNDLISSPSAKKSSPGYGQYTNEQQGMNSFKFVPNHNGNVVDIDRERENSVKESPSNYLNQYMTLSIFNTNVLNQKNNNSNNQTGNDQLNMQHNSSNNIGISNPLIQLCNNNNHSQDNEEDDNDNDQVEEGNEGTEGIEGNEVINTPSNEEYIFEKFGKRGWQCEYCNNFNFETRQKCNRCKMDICPKPLSKIRHETNEDGTKIKKPLIEREGDWQCHKCHNLNFSFRHECNRCKLARVDHTNPYNMPPSTMTPYSNMFPMPSSSFMPMYPNPQTPMEYQHMFNGNINIYNNYYNKGMYPNMNMMNYPAASPFVPSHMPQQSNQIQMDYANQMQMMSGQNTKKKHQHMMMKGGMKGSNRNYMQGGEGRVGISNSSTKGINQGYLYHNNEEGNGNQY